MILSSGSVLQLPVSELRISREVAVASPTFATLETAEREHILKVLKETNWTIGGPGGASMRLGMKRTTLQSKMKKLGIHRPQS